jgi:aldose 1-epimerase
MHLNPLSNPPDSPNGPQWSIGHGRQHAVITAMGATLREYTLGGVPVIDGFEGDEWPHSGRGQVLAPWPNRLGDGRYQFAGVEAQAALSEPELGNAIHGLVRWWMWQLEALAQNKVVLACTVHPTPDYPFWLAMRVEYHLGREGLVVTTTAENVGGTTLPFGIGFHPYLTVGTALIDTAWLHLPARHRLVLDERALPTGEVQPVAGTEFDFTSGRSIGPTQMDTAFTDLVRGADGRAVAALRDPERDVSVKLWADECFGYLMCYTGDTVGEVSRRRTAVAVEPMTCPPDAFRSGRGLIVLEPGQAWEGCWGITPG